ncbi:uncharacterized protein LOC113590371 [Electrophorus electricus]|uniref:uncharacterized protein LOC113590371 n=1 Tax=Electrophorus electricus TaxID=8005 RepID=UPI0015D09F9B|nr:uncharacterized protein LOC113590371 [Electrophorus electricus]
MEKVSSASHVIFQWMFLYLLLLLNSPVCLSYYSGNRYQFACVGQDVQIAVDSRSRLVTFHSTAWQRPRKVVLENTSVKDPRYEWMRNMTLIIRNVTSEDQGLYSIKSPITGFSFETVHLTVSDCLKRFSRNYGETFKLEIPQYGDMLEFLSSSHSLVPKHSSSPPTVRSPAEPVVVWTTAKFKVGGKSHGHVRNRYWVIDSVAPSDQGTYTVKDSNGTVVSRISLTVRAHMFNLTLSSKESLFVQLWGLVPGARLFFSPTLRAIPTTPSVVFRDGGIVDSESHYRGRLSLLRNDTGVYVVISALSGKDDGIYELWDAKGNLVSRTVITVKERNTKWRGVIKSISVPSGMFATLAGFILFMKRYPRCSVTNILSGLRDRHCSTRANSGTLQSQDYRHDTAYFSDSSYGSRASVKRNSSPSYSGYLSIIDNTENKSPSPLRMGYIDEEARTDSAGNHEEEMIKEHDLEKKISVSVPGDSNWLKPSDVCIQFDIGRKEGRGVEKNEEEHQDYFSILPLNTDTSHLCSVYTSEKLSFH